MQIVGGYFDEVFKEATMKLFDRWISGDVTFVASYLLELELLNAPKQVRELLPSFTDQ